MRSFRYICATVTTSCNDFHNGEYACHHRRRGDANTYTRQWLTARPDLATVAEQDADHPDDAQHQKDIATAEQEAVDDEAELETTPKTPFSQEEIAELDPDVMVDVLPNLATAAEQLSSLLLPADLKARPAVWREIRARGSRHQKLLNNRTASLLVHKHSFGNQEYIEPSIVLRALLGVQTMANVPDGLWRPDSIIYKINLAQMLHTTLVTIGDPLEYEYDIHEALVGLVRQFPSAVAGSSFDTEAVQTCLELQTQLTIVRLHLFSGFDEYDPSSIVSETFYNRDEEGVYVFHDALGMDQLDPVELDVWTDKIGDLVSDLQAPFRGQGLSSTEESLEAVRALFPWHGAVDEVVKYFEMRASELNSEIAEAGGVDVIVASLSEEVEGRYTERLVAEKRQSFGKSGGTPKQALSGIAALKAREQRLSSQVAQAQPAPAAQMMDPRLTQEQEQAPNAPADEWAALPDDDDEEQTAIQQHAQSALQQLTGFQNSQRQNAKGKQRSFNDRQDNAQRISFTDSQSQPRSQAGPSSGVPGRSSAPGPYHISPKRNAKRTHAEVDNGLTDFEPTQDEGFQNDVRDTSAADARRKSAPRPQPSQRRAASATTVAYEYPGSNSAPKRQRKNPGSSIPLPVAPTDPEAGEIPSSEYYQRAKNLAIQNRLVAASQKAPQVRTPWDEAEEFALVELIEEHGGDGISYAGLKNKDSNGDNRLARRSGEDMRFKARNMKQTFIL